MGGPGREIAKFSGANVVGLNCSDYQLERAREHTRKAQLQDLCTYVKVSLAVSVCEKRERERERERKIGCMHAFIHCFHDCTLTG